MKKPINDLKKRKLAPESLMMSYGYKPHLSQGALKCPIFQTSTFVFESAEDGKAFFQVAYGLPGADKTREQGLIYSRINNPDLEILEDRLALWDEAEASAVFPSGMGAISTVLLEFLRPGYAILHTQPLYGGTHHFLEKICNTYGIESIGVPANATKKEIEEIIKKSKFGDKIALIYLETPANPTNDIIDISLYAGIAKKLSTKKKIVRTVVDNTFLGPLWQQPLHHGADLVIYSATKFIGGHSDLIAGVCLGSKELVGRVKVLRTFLGTILDPWTCWLLMRSLETLKIRMTEQMENAQKIALFLSKHPKVKKVYYPGLLKKGDPQFEVYKKQCTSPGSMISFDVKGGEKEAFLVLNNLGIIHLAVSLGGTESLAEHPASMTHADILPKDRAIYGITENMIRLSVGIENVEDLINALDFALSKI